MRTGQRRIPRVLMACALVAALGLLPDAIPVRAAGVVGNGTPGSCTEAALNTALAGGGTITFNCGPALHTIPITSQKSINANTTIDGGGKITLDGQDAHRLFDVGATLTLRNIVLTRGYFNGDGGAIRNTSNGTLVLQNSTIRNSRATLSGGAILSTGPLTIINSLLEGNQARNGGALYPRFAGAQTTIVNSVLRDNHATDVTGWGGAILAWDGARVTIEGSDIHENTAGDGAGIYNFANSVLTLRGNTRLHDNNAGGSGGGVFNAGTATLTDVTLSDNQARGGLGGGISNEDGTATLTKVTLNGNTAGVGGGGLANIGTATLTNVTFSDNWTAGNGGGMYNTFATASLTNVTLTGNTAFSGGGLHHRLNGSLTVRNTIVANSPSGQNCAGAIGNAGGNLSSDASCGFGSAVNVMLGPLANNGGPTLTHRPLPGSPAIDFVTAGCPPPATDQRGVTRPVDGDRNGSARCDAGAVEYRISSVYLPLLLK